MTDPAGGLEALLSPIRLGPATAPNRILFGPHATNLGRARTIGRRHVAYYRRRAAGGAGVVVTEEASVHPGDWPYERAPLAAACASGWEDVAAACRAHGALAIAALGHSGAQGSSLWSRAALWAPSRVADPTVREVPKEMEAVDVDAVVAGFAAGAAVAAGAGMHGVEVNAGQHSLIRQCCSGLTNHRADRWGVDRGALAEAVVVAVRAAAGGGVVGLRLSCDELAPWAGITPAAGAAMAARLAPLVDYLVVVRGSLYSPGATRPDSHEPAGFNRELTASVRVAVGGAVPIFWQGSIVDVTTAGTAVTAGVCDGVEMTRAQIADPDLVAKAAGGRPTSIRPCVLCNQACMVRDERAVAVSCVVEPSAGHEAPERSRPRPARRGPRPARLLVVGAGPGGLECARVAASAGWEVTVAEREHAVGGALTDAARAAGRGHLAGLGTWLTAECRRLGVTVECGRTVDLAEIGGHQGPVVVATGSRARPPRWPVGSGATVVDARTWLRAVGSRTPAPGEPLLAEPLLAEPLLAEPLPAGPVVVWDPVGGPVAVSVCETVAAIGGCATLVTPDPVAGLLLAPTGDLAPANGRLRRAGVDLVTRAEVTAIEAGGVLVTARIGGAGRWLPAAVVVDAGPRLAEDRLWRTAPDLARRVGDAVAPRDALLAVLEGRSAADALSRTVDR